MLIVEDEQPIREGYKEIFNRADFEVVTAENGLIAIEKLHSGTFDIMLLDLMMPELDGLGTLDKMLEDGDKYKEMPIIVLTALGSDSVIKKAFEKGANGYLIKTEFNPDEILLEVMSYLE